MVQEGSVEVLTGVEVEESVKAALEEGVDVLVVVVAVEPVRVAVLVPVVPSVVVAVCARAMPVATIKNVATIPMRTKYGLVVILFLLRGAIC